jgi:cytochrome c biogenesis protein CcmG/thiol:disulfide interchange protein DsbE
MTKRFRYPIFRKAAKLALAAMLPCAGLPTVALADITHADATSALDLAQYRGKVVYVDFWASWCAPCKLSFPFMAELRRAYAPKDLVIVTINVDRNRAAAAGFLNAVGAGLPVIYDPEGALASRFKVASMPTSFVIGRDGQQRFVHRGYFDAKAGEYAQHVAALVAERP